MMEFFGRMVSKAARVLQLWAQSRLSTQNNLELRCLLEILQQKLQHVSQQAAVAQDQVEVVVLQIHGTLEEILDAITLLLPNTASPQALHPELLAQYPTVFSVEIHKLDVLMWTLKISDGKPFNVALPSVVTQRETKVSNYIDFEFIRCGLSRPQDTDIVRKKWHHLNSYKYLQNISEDSLQNLNTLGQIVNAFGRCLHFAKPATCARDDRWLYLAFCARFLLLARASSDYKRILQGGELCALIVQDYLTELEMDLLTVFIESPTQYQKREWIAQRTQKQSSEQPTVSGNLMGNIMSSQDIFVWSCNMGGSQLNMNFGLRRGPGGSLVLRPSRWLPSLECLRSRKSYECDLIIKKNESTTGETASVRLYFKHASELKRFQAILSGWVVMNDYGSGVPFGILKKKTVRTFGRARPVDFVGRLQLWDRTREHSPEVSENNMEIALTGFTNSSQTTVSSNATIRAAEALPFSQISMVNGREGLMNSAPPKPLLVLLEESPERKIHALSVPPPPKAEIDESLCECKNTGSNCSRSFIRYVQNVDLKVSRYEHPKEREVLDWVEVDLGTKPGREQFTADLQVRWKSYSQRLGQTDNNSSRVFQGHFNTHSYQQR
ncbi:hypothetical protein F5882DRAFT_41697 [Hyaloscypha sp. PMI_1271]|nr:hypothetical protein F5882DRAFT_41697 [Hyaloscypha sp. PMI_1271]